MAKASGRGYTSRTRRLPPLLRQSGAILGIYLIANDQPLAVREWLPAFARWLDAPAPPQISVEDGLPTNGADAVYYGTQMRGVSNAKAKRELTFQPRPLEWVVDTAPAHRGRSA